MSTNELILESNYKQAYLNKSRFSLQKISGLYKTGGNLFFLNQDNKQVKIEKIEKVNYSGKIYDVTVPNHIILVRRNRIPVWSGNSLVVEFQHNSESARPVGVLGLPESEYSLSKKESVKNEKVILTIPDWNNM